MSREPRPLQRRPDGAARHLDGLAAMVERAGRRDRGLPPVDRWNPDFSGDLDMVIRADGSWYYMGTPIARMSLVRLFASVLRKDADGRTFLVTPVEKFAIAVEDAHFIAVEMHAGERDGRQCLTFRTNVGDIVEAGPAHPLRFVIEPENGGIRPYLRVRGRLDALLARSVLYPLIELGREMDVGGTPVFAVESLGEIFPVMPADELSRQLAASPGTA